MQLFNQFSFPLMMLAVGVILLMVIIRLPRLSNFLRAGIVLVYALIAVIIGITFQYPASPIQVETVADVEAALINEKPTFVMLYSNY